jgi:DNA-binding NarL/FixJ family response regulator
MGIKEDRKTMNEIMKKLEKNEKSIRDVEIFTLFKNGNTVAEVAETHGVSESTVRRAVNKFEK